MAYPTLVAPIESALDYLTVTARTPEHKGTLKDIGHGLVRELQADGHDCRPFAWKGYEGISAGWATWAEREDTVLLRISGGWADTYFEYVAPHADNCSRIDLAVTARMPADCPDLAHETFREVSASSRLRGKPLSASYLVNSEGGSTCYVGSRRSDLFARLYNKSVESGLAEYQECWRWEMEVKGKAARGYADAVSSATSRPGLIAATVANYFARRGSRVSFDGGNISAIRPLPLEKSDDQRRMRWLKNQVAPVLGKMSARVAQTDLALLLGLSVTSS